MVRVAPQVVADGVGNLARIGSSIGVANAAAAAATTTMVPAGGDEVSAAAVADGQFQVLAEPVQTLGQAWLASPAGELLDPLVNAPFELLTGRELIGNGAAGVAGVDGGAGTAAPRRQPDGPGRVR